MSTDENRAMRFCLTSYPERGDSAGIRWAVELILISTMLLAVVGTDVE